MLSHHKYNIEDMMWISATEIKCNRYIVQSSSLKWDLNNFLQIVHIGPESCMFAGNA